MATPALSDIYLQDSDILRSRHQKSRSISPLRWRGGSTSPSDGIALERLDSNKHLVDLRKCFTELRHMGLLLEELHQKDLQLSSLLQSKTTSESSLQQETDSDSEQDTPPAGLTLAEPFRDFVDSFVSMFLQSKFVFSRGIDPQQDPHNIILTLASSKKCPALVLFQRVCVNPMSVASDQPESENHTTYKGIPVNQLARFCDIAVLRFLSMVSEHTSTTAVLWALDYIYNLLYSLITSLNRLHSIGWYNAPPSRYRKRTTLNRLGSSVPPAGVIPSVHVVGSPPRDAPNLMRDPETGQPSLTPRYMPPSAHIPQQASTVSLPTEHATGVQPFRQTLSASSLATVLPDSAGFGDSRVTCRESRPESSNLLRPPSPEPPSSDRTSDKSPSSSRRSSSSSSSSVGVPLSTSVQPLPPGWRPSAAASSPLGLSPPKHSMESIPEENEFLASYRQQMDSIELDYFDNIEEEVDPAVAVTLEPDFSCPSGRTPPILEARSPVLGSIQEEEEIESTGEIIEVEGQSNRAYQHPYAVTHSPSPPPGQYLQQDTPTSPTEEVRSKPSSFDWNKDVPQVDIENELKTLMNGEGRVSLIAILNAIANLPQMFDLWTEEVGLKCFSLIQLCINLGLAQAEDTDEPAATVTAETKRKRFQKQENVAFQTHGAEKPHWVHSKHIVEYSVSALVHCATSMIIGCTNDNGLCHLTYKRMPSQNHSIYDKVIRSFRRLHHSPTHFRQALTKFATTAPCRKLFHFLHVVLQYCTRGRDNLDSLVVSLVASVLRITVDRLGQINLMEPSIQNSIVTEACNFFQYAQVLFSQDTLKQPKAFRHLHMYIHRIALSVVLPPPPLQLSETPQFPLIDASPAIPLADNLPLQKRTKQDKPRKRAGSLPSHRISDVSNQPSTTKSTKAHHRVPLTKQPSVHSDTERQRSYSFEPESHPERRRGEEPPLKEWHGLRLDLLRSRIQRLVVLMSLSEPGTVPDAGMLASLIDLADGTSLVARAMVLLECALFVSKLSQTPHIWVQHYRDSSYNVCFNLRKWGDAIGEKLRLTELRERELEKRLKRGALESDDPIVLPEEPVFPDDDRGEDGEQVVSYAIKMVACNLLLEITRFLNDPPAVFSGPSLSLVSTPRVSSSHLERWPSDVSSDGESIKGWNTLNPADFRPPLNQSIYSSSLSFDDYDSRGHSFDEGGLPPNPRKNIVSVYLRVNSSNGVGAGGANRSSSFRSRKQTVAIRELRILDSPAETHPNWSQGSPGGRRKKLSVSQTATSLHHAAVYGGVGGSLGGAPKSPRRPSLSAGAAKPPSAGFHRLKPAVRRRSTSTQLHKATYLQEGDFRPPLLSQSSTASTKGHPGASLGASLNEGLSRLRRSAQRAFRKVRKRQQTPEVHTPGGGSPSLAQRKKLQQRRSSVTGSLSQVMGLEDRRRYSWLDVVEHLILMDASNPEAHKMNKRSCAKLIAALSFVYADSSSERLEFGIGMTMSRSLSTIFTESLAPSDGSRPSSAKYSRTTSLPLSLHIQLSQRHSRKSRAARTISLPDTNKVITYQQPVVNPLAALNFSMLNCERFTSTFLLVTSSNKRGSIELFLEEEAPYSMPYVTAKLDKQRRNYVRDSFAGLMHVPLSLLVSAAPILHPTYFSNLKDVAWEVLLDTDQELAKAAGAFFLLSCAKESEAAMRMFVKDKVERAEGVKQVEAIQRFVVLWQTRYSVWPHMEERAQKKFNTLTEKEKDEDEDQLTIGYSLPANPLGSSGRSIPVAPWEPASICTGRNCESNPNKCFQPTRHAPILHEADISEQVTSYNVSGVSVPQEASTVPVNVYYGELHENSTGNINDIQWEAVEPTLFPRSLLPLIRFVIMALHPSPQKRTTSSSSLASSSGTAQSVEADTTMAAQQAVWACMVEDPRLFFRPLLNQFNKVYKLISDKKNKEPLTQVNQLLSEVLHPLHVVIQAFPVLPPRAAHYLFNNFIGVIMRHTDQPYILSTKVIQSVLTLISMVSPSVQGLDSKVLKGVLKKESCYTTIMSTARIRGVEKVQLVNDQPPYDRRVYEVTDDMTFGELIAAARNEPLSLDLLQKWCLVDECKDLPVLSSLVVQDHYSSPADRQHRTFILQRAENVWGQQMDQWLFRYKMSEVMRVLLLTRLLLTGPGVEKGFHYSEFAQPNYRFIHSELVELNSFPRKALMSLLYEAGQSAFQDRELRTSDIMLKGLWARFILQLFTSVKADYEWSNSMALFLNVINGSILLHSEDHSILRFCLASLLTAASKFRSVFKKDGYQTIVPTIVQVYSLHMRNRLVTGALKFIWTQFYLLDKNVFLLQVIAATATILSEEAAILSSNVASACSTFVHSQIVEGEEAQRIHSLAVFQLLDALDIDGRNMPADELDILGCCPHPHPQDDWQLPNTDNWSRCTLQNMLYLCVTLASWNPEALRGMQVLVFLDHLMPLFLKAFTTSHPNLSAFAISLLRHLVKGCEPITKPQTWHGDILSTRKQGGGGPPVNPLQQEQKDNSPSNVPKEPAAGRKTSVVAQQVQRFRVFLNPNRKDMAVSEEASNEPPVPSKTQPRPSHFAPLDHSTYIGEFKLRTIQDASQRVLKLSRQSLLSLSAKFVVHHFGGDRSGSRESFSRQPERPRHVLDAQSFSILTSMVKELLKQAIQNETVLQGRGLNSFMSDLLPNIAWTETHYSSFSNILKKILGLFKKLQNSPNKAVLVWDSLATIITGLTHCIQNHSSLVVGHEQHFTKMKQLLECILSVNVGVLQQSANSRGGRLRGVQCHLLQDAPTSFCEAVVGLAVELICVTQLQADFNPRFRYQISDLLSQKLTIHEYEETINHKILLPVCIQLGLREDIGCPSRDDAEFVLQIMDKKVENVLRIARSPNHPSQYLQLVPFFRGLKVICCAFSETFTLQEWYKIAHWLLSLAQRKIDVTLAKKISTTSLASEHGSQASSRFSRHSSTSSAAGPTILEVFITFQSLLLNFFETFLLMYQVPLFPLLWPLLGIMEVQLKAALQGAKMDNPALYENIRYCVLKCQSLQTEGPVGTSTISRHILLREFQEELKEVTHSTRTLLRSRTTVERRTRPKPASRRERVMSLSRIGEAHEENEGLIPSPSRKRSTAPKKSSTSRPTFLRLGSPPKYEPETNCKSRENTMERMKKPPLPKQQYKPLEQPRRAVTKKSSPMSSLSPPESSPAVSHNQRKRSRPPKLAQLKGKLGSSEFHADTEDSLSPDVTPKHSITSPPVETELIITNENTDVQAPAGASITVHAEIHELESVSSDTGTASSGGDPARRGSTAPLLTNRIGTKRPVSIPNQDESYEVFSDTDELLQSSRAHPPICKSEGRLQPKKKSQSLEFISLNKP